MMEILFGGVTVLFLAMSVAALINLRWARRLPALRDLPMDREGAPRVRCSVVVPAHNEEGRIERTKKCSRSLLAARRVVDRLRTKNLSRICPTTRLAKRMLRDIA